MLRRKVVQINHHAREDPRALLLVKRILQPRVCIYGIDDKQRRRIIPAFEQLEQFGLVDRRRDGYTVRRFAAPHLLQPLR